MIMGNSNKNKLNNNTKATIATIMIPRIHNHALIPFVVKIMFHIFT